MISVLAARHDDDDIYIYSIYIYIYIIEICGYIYERNMWKESRSDEVREDDIKPNEISHI